MTLDEAIELVGRWPSDRSVPKRLAAGIAEAEGEEVVRMGQLVEALMTASSSAADYDLIARYFP